MECSYYCPQKFFYLKVDLEKRLLYNCHKAYPHRITSDWLKKNPGKIFNTDIMTNERQLMLQGERNDSCGYSCYKAEDKGSISHRMQVLETNKKQYNNPYAECEVLDLIMSSDCNLSCVYCSGIFSSAWRREVKQHGEYVGLTKNWSDIYDKASQKEKGNTEFFRLFLEEIKSMKKLRQVIITGGEPLLLNRLEALIDLFGQDVKVSVFTGLGVSQSRFNNLIKLFTKKKNVTLVISAEGTGKHHEFVRHGANYKKFQQCLKILADNKINFRFCCTVSNLSVIGLHEFYTQYNQQTALSYNHCVHPSFLQKHILDDDTKRNLIKIWSSQNDDFSRYVVSGLEHPVNEQERKSLSVYLKQLTKRRNLQLDFLPASFRSWTGLI